MTEAINPQKTIYFEASKKQYPQGVKKLANRHVINLVVGMVCSAGLYGFWLLFKIYALNVLFMPSTFKFHKGPMSQESAHLMRTATKVTLKTIDGVKLDAREIILPNATKWMIFLGGNGSRQADMIPYRTKMASDLGVNILLMDYRDVGVSKGKLLYGSQLMIDGSIALEYLKQHHRLKEEDITILGHSMGGGVGAKLTDFYPNIKLISDRSYSSTGDVIPKLKGFMKLCGYQINALKSWVKIPDKQKLVIYHKDDTVIPYKQSSLYYADKKQRKLVNPHHKNVRGGLKHEHKPHRIKLRSFTQVNAHCIEVGALRLNPAMREIMRARNELTLEHENQIALEYQEFLTKAKKLIFSH